jgi:hypothetical protein
MNMFEELKVWADKWKVPYKIREHSNMVYIEFDAQTYGIPQFSYNKETGDFLWYGGD